MRSYATDLAMIHDAGYGEYARCCAPGLLRILRDAGIAAGLVVDLGCGSGIWIEQLVAAGYDALGVDISADMIALARQRVHSSRFLQSSYLNAKIPACRVVTALGEVFNYRFDGGANPSSLKRLFRRVFSALEPGGQFIFDIAEPGRGGAVRQHHRTAPDWACLVDFDCDDAKHRLKRRIVTFRKMGQMFRRDEETHELQLYPARSITKWLRETGFKVRMVRQFGDFPLHDHMAGFVARRP